MWWGSSQDESFPIGPVGAVVREALAQVQRPTSDDVGSARCLAGGARFRDARQLFQPAAACRSDSATAQGHPGGTDGPAQPPMAENDVQLHPLVQLSSEDFGEGAIKGEVHVQPHPRRAPLGRAWTFAPPDARLVVVPDRRRMSGAAGDRVGRQHCYEDEDRHPCH